MIYFIFRFGRTRRNLVDIFTNTKNKLTKWLKKMERQEKKIDDSVEDVETSLVEYKKVKSTAEDLSTGDDLNARVVKIFNQIQVEMIWSESEMEENQIGVNLMSHRYEVLKKNVEEKQQKFVMFYDLKVCVTTKMHCALLFIFTSLLTKWPL